MPVDVCDYYDLLRNEDKEELKASASMPPYLVLMDTIIKSENKFTLFHEGKFVGFIGCGSGGIMWGMSTDDFITNHRIAFTKISKIFIDSFISEYGMLQNYIYKENTKHINWIKKMGFIVEDKTYIHPETNKEFLKFKMENSNV